MRRGGRNDKDTMAPLRSWLLTDARGPDANADVLCRAFTAPRQIAAPTPGRRIAARVSAVSDAAIEADLDIAMSHCPWAILLPRCRSGVDVQQLAAKLAVREARLGLTAGVTGIVAVVGDSAAGVCNLASFAGASPRLIALAANAGALRRDLGRAAPAGSRSPARASRSPQPRRRSPR